VRIRYVEGGVVGSRCDREVYEEVREEELKGRSESGRRKRGVK
jgi:hypothetical protein